MTLFLSVSSAVLGGASSSQGGHGPKSVTGHGRRYQNAWRPWDRLREPSGGENASGRELAADLCQVALLVLVEHGERAAHALGVLWEETVDDLAAAEGERDARRAAVLGQA